MPSPSTLPPETPPPTWRGLNWWLFLGALAAPALITIFVARSETARIAVMLVGSTVVALFCGFQLSTLCTQNNVGRAVLGLVFAGALFMVSVILCCFGCTIGGGTVNIH